MALSPESIWRGTMHLLLISSVLLLTVAVSAQGGAVTPAVANLLETGEPQTVSLDAVNPGRVLTFQVPVTTIVTIDVSSDTIQPAVLLTNISGATLSQVVGDPDTTSASIEGLSLTAGAYFITLFPAPGSSVAEGEVTVVLQTEVQTAEPTQSPGVPTPTESPELTEEVPQDTTEATNTPEFATTWEPPTRILIAGGIEVNLSWDAPVDLNLEVRDPEGNSLFWNSRQSPVGGNFGFDANGLCEVITDNPVETASWVPGFLPTGSYEILVFYVQACEDAVPVSFNVDVTVNGVAQQSFEGALAPPQNNQDSVYIASFNVAPDGDATLFPGDVYPDSSLNFLPDSPANIIAAAQPVTVNEPVIGALYRDQPYLSYSFPGQANDAVSISLQAISGSLDTLLQVMDSSGTVIQVNDDQGNTTDSLLERVRLVQTDTYYIVATRYGKELGGTEGEFELLVSAPELALPPQIFDLGLPQGDIAVLLTWNTGADLQLLVRDPIGDAVFDDRPRINSGGILASNGNVNCQQSEGAPVSYIYWPTGTLRPGTYETEVWYQSTCNDPTPVEFTLTVIVDGEVLLQEIRQPLPNQRFVVSFTIEPDRNVIAGQGGYTDANSSVLNYGAETPQPIGLNVPVSGTLSQANVFDVYAFEGTAGQTITIAMNAISQTLDTKLFLISPSGVEVALNDDADPLLVPSNNGRTTNSLIPSYTLQESGTYLIIATRYATIYGGTIGAYTLDVQG